MLKQSNIIALSTMQNSRLQNYTIYYNNSEEYHTLKREVFTADCYYFETENPTPYIIDAGAHIGLSTLYFKQLFPGSEILAIEPNPGSFQLLEKNIFENQITGVTTIQAALSEQTGQEQLFLDETNEQWHSTASFHKGSWVGSQKTTSITVSTHTLSEFVTKPVDFLKLDIEGSEQKVLFEAKNSLHLIKEMHIEFHTHATQSLKKLLDLLEQTHKVELYKNTTPILKEKIHKTSGLIQIRAYKRSKA